MNKEVEQEKSWKKGLQAAELWKEMTLCESPLIFNYIGTTMLHRSLETLSKLPKDKITEADKVRLEKLKKGPRQY